MGSGMSTIDYMNEVLRNLEGNEDMRTTADDILKQSKITAAGCAVGGLLGGPFGAAAGAGIGALIAFGTSTDYDSLIAAIKKMSNSNKEELGKKIQRLVGSASIEAFVRWIVLKENRIKLLDLLSNHIKNLQ